MNSFKSTLILFLFTITTIAQVNNEQFVTSSMNKNYCYASSAIEVDNATGPRSTINPPKIIDNKIAEGLFLVVDNSNRLHNNKIAKRVCFYNNSEDTILFTGQDGRLNIIREAKNKKGDWKPIEFLPFAHCGNSFHEVYIKHNQYWEFIVPTYHGDLKTKLRFKATLADGTIVYSDPYNGSINENQFIMSEKDLPHYLRHNKK